MTYKTCKNCRNPMPEELFPVIKKTGQRGEVCKLCRSKKYQLYNANKRKKNNYKLRSKSC